MTNLNRRLDAVNDDHHDFIWYVLKQRDKFDLRKEEIIANSALFILAGSETTANSLCGLTARLLQNRKAYDKLVKEIRDEFDSEEAINHDQTMRMEYLNACINEGLRASPPITPGLLRTVPDDNEVIDGHPVAKGTTVSVSAWAAAHNPANFARPDEFIPERWIDDSFKNDHFRSSQPFSIGPRACLGKKLVRLSAIRTS